MPKNLVIVESPAKAHTIEKYLGKDFHVLASVGHIRKDTKVDKDTFDVTYEIDPDHTKIINDLKKAAASADTIWLATDEDREGEAISWHLMEVLKLPKNTNRITFHEITKPALENAIQHPRKIDMDMVHSQQARQTLDMLVGYDLSGVVRRKVPGAISAGRVQSPALRLVVEKEQEIEKFTTNTKFKVTGEFLTQDKSALSATLDHTFDTEKTAQNYLEKIADAKFQVADIITTPGVRRPAPPFTTASMQIEANSRLGFSTRTTMTAAQALYQAGFITYHRTDSLNLSKQALAMTANYVEEKFGKKYLQVRNFKTKSASAQEAHEAIRPTHIDQEVAGKNEYEKKLYRLIRNRTLATQMAEAKTEKTTVKIINNTEKTHLFEAKGEVIVFDGFLKVTGRTKEDELPALNVDDYLKASKITARQSFAKPPARYTEGSLVKKLEELGIGRPSTYASIMQAIQSRGYVIKGESEGEPREVIQLTLEKGKVKREIVTEKTGSTKGKLLPTPIGELLAGFLTDNFNNIVDYQFTANIEEDLDKIADHQLERVQMLRDFYGPFQKEVQKSDDAARYNNARELGKHPKTGQPIYAKIGRNGGFIQLGDNEKTTGEKPQFAPLPQGMTEKTVTLEAALKQLDLPALPRELGTTKDGATIVASSGPFGPYLKAGKYNIQLKDHDPYTIDFETASRLYQEKIDSIIADWGEIMIINGAYGPYIKGPGRFNNIKIPKEQDPKKITFEEAKQMLDSKPAGRGKFARKNTKTNTKSAKKASSTAKKASKKSTSRTTKVSTKTPRKASKTAK
jgi:DNA topoisomerase-1